MLYVGMKARFKTQCSECGGTIKVGQEITKSGEKWVHKKCAEDTGKGEVLP
ncbi:MAG: hypothetical protein HYU39_11050 [Thaumarchaeota archaeon]|nr:hypothetical protein [Nitrososphaerota archaeon]